MADTDKPQKITIGFEGGGGVSARVAPAALEELRRALRSGPSGWHDLEAEDAAIALDLAKVVYLLVDTEAHRVGFGG